MVRFKAKHLLRTTEVMFFSIPNIMTWTRIAAIPFIVFIFDVPLDMETKNAIATVLFILFALTDWLDGYLARKLNQTSAFGAFLATKLRTAGLSLVVLPSSSLSKTRLTTRLTSIFF